MRELRRLTGRTDRLFAMTDLRCLLPKHSEAAFRPLVSRLVKRGDLIRLCRGIYMLDDCELRGSALLGRVVVLLRANCFNYLSLETVLSEAGVISQIPMGRITVMSSGRSNVISCGDYGVVEIVHTQKTPSGLTGLLTYDSSYGLWRASVVQALQDIRDTHRDTGLVNWEIANEFVR